MQRILAAVDHSEASLKAAELAIDLAAKYRSALLLLTVVPALVEPTDPGWVALARAEQVRAPASTVVLEVEREALAGLSREATARGVPEVRADAVIGDPAEEILFAAAANGTDLIVVGTRGRGRLAGLLIGSVAQKLVSLAKCPVLVVR